MTREIKDTQRKRRLPRLSSALLSDDMMPDDTSGGPFVRWNPTEDHWRVMEKVCSLPFDADDREEIGSLVASYFQTQPFERSAPFEIDAEIHLDKLQRAADGFYQILLSSEELENETLERNAAIQIRMSISIRLKETHCALTSIDDFQKAMEGFLAAAIVVRHELNAGKGKGFVEGEAWTKLVKGLARWFASKSLRVTASKSGKPSLFVAFMWELQGTFPERFRRYHHSKGALAKAMSAALAGP